MAEMATGQTKGPVVVIAVLAGALALALLGGIVWASAASDVVAGLRYLAADRWGVVTLIDVYAGAFVVAVWIWVHERRLVTWVPWVVALVCLGHLVSLVYLLVWLWRGGLRAGS